MRARVVARSAIIGVIATLGCGREQVQPPSRAPAPPDAEHGLVIHLQEGFHRGLDAVITIDEREVYRGVPETSPVLGFAECVSVAAASARPRVTFALPGKQISWSQQIDLSAGAALGISVTEDGAVKIRQAPAFAYD